MASDVSLKVGTNEYANFFTIFDEKIASKCLRGVTVLERCVSANHRQEAAAAAAASDFLDGLVVADRMSCSTCGVDRFDCRREQVAHYKTDWHCHNLKRRLDKKPAVDEVVYMQIVLTGERPGSPSSSEAEDAKSDSNEGTASSANDSHGDAADITEPKSEDESVIPVVRRSARLFFHNEGDYLFSIHRCVITSKQDESSNEELAERIGELVSCGQPKWAVILLGGGHFAAAVFNGHEVVIHKTLHRYVVRAKQGSSQGTHDRIRHAVSAGAALRRHNERALETEVQSLLMGPWQAHLSDCSLVFHRSAGGSNRRILFGGNRKPSPFDRHDIRLRTIPFATRRACFREVVAVHRKLATVECHGPAIDCRETDVRQEKGRSSPRKRTALKKNTAKSEKSGKIRQVAPDLTSESSAGDTDDDELIWEADDVVCDFTELKMSDCTASRSKQRKNKTKTGASETSSHASTASRDRLYTACKLARLEVIREIVAGIAESLDSASEFLNRPFGKMDTTYLHVVVHGGCRGAVSVLLESGADPTLKDSMGRSPYALTVDVEIRKEFRRFRARFPDRYDYNAAHIPAPLSEADEKAKAERQRLLRSQRRHRAKEQATEARDRHAFLNLTDTEKRRASGETRDSSSSVLLMPPRCFTCAKSLQGTVPFEYDRFKFCQIPCLKEHRLKNRK